MIHSPKSPLLNIVSTPELIKTAGGGDDLTNCPVCFDEYTETGDHIPRLPGAPNVLSRGSDTIFSLHRHTNLPRLTMSHEPAKPVKMSEIKGKRIIS